MAKKANFSIRMQKDNSLVEVTGETHGSWGIHKRNDGMFVLTHLDTGMLVVSANKKKELVELLNDPEFKEKCWGAGMEPSQADVHRLSKVIKDFYGNCKKKCRHFN